MNGILIDHLAAIFHINSNDGKTIIAEMTEHSYTDLRQAQEQSELEFFSSMINIDVFRYKKNS